MPVSEDRLRKGKDLSMKKKLALMMALSLTMGTLLTGCGKGADETAQTAAETTETEVDETEEAEEAQETLEEVDGEEATATVRTELNEDAYNLLNYSLKKYKKISNFS